jgi:hypothetical protein
MNKKKYEFKNPDQIINMGGPWIGDFYYEDVFISKDIIIDNLLFSDNKVYFVKYHSPSKKRSDIFFTICCWNIDMKSISESTQMFDMLYLKEMISDNEMIICNAFHGEMPESCFNFSITPEAFHPVVT